MTEHKTFPGKVYAVTAATDCTVTDPSGLTLATVAAGEQKAVVATSDRIFTSADATVTAVFKGAPAALGLLGGGNSGGGGGGGIEGDYLLYDANGVVTGGRMDEVTDISHMFRTVARQTEWNIPLPKVTNAAYAFASSGIVNWTLDLPEATDVSYLLNGAKSLVEVNASFPKATNAFLTFYAATAQRITLRADSLKGGGAFRNLPNLTYLHLTAPLTDMSEICRGSTALSEVYFEGVGVVIRAAYAFEGCVLNKPSVLRILNLLPTWTSGSHGITLGIHIDHQEDAEVLAAIDAATAKGWTVTVQWNGTASS